MDERRLVSYYLSEFKDKKLEADFFKSESSDVQKYIRPVVLALGILFFLFIVPDYFLNEDRSIFLEILLIRSSFLLLVFLLFIRLGMQPDYRTISRWLSAYMIIVSLFFLLIFYLYETPNLYIQSFGVIALILAFFLVPNRWIYDVLISLFLGAGFLAIARYRFDTYDSRGFAAVGVYIALVLVISAVSSYRVNVYKRMQYLYSKKLKHLSETDSLTGIFVRSKFNEELNKWIDLAQRYDHALSLVFFDIDDLKKVNDQYGHLAGDMVLSSLAGVVKGVIRRSDVFARWGGDEFAILLPNTGQEQAYELVERIRTEISRHQFEPVGAITCSFGVAAYHKGDDVKTLLGRADQNLYHAKNKGKNLIV